MPNINIIIFILTLAAIAIFFVIDHIFGDRVVDFMIRNRLPDFFLLFYVGIVMTVSILIAVAPLIWVEDLWT